MAAVEERMNTMIAVHLDLKGQLFRPRYLPQYLEDLASLGVNAVLVEYEDVFPFAGVDAAWRSEDVWPPRLVRRFQADAAQLGIEIIPLQQCLGHLEWLLRWKRYRGLAEHARYPCTLCLSRERGKALVRDMLRQVIEAHPDSRYVHLGMDEAHGLASCPRCKARGDTLGVFVDYLEELCDFVEPFGKTPIIWSDMFEDHYRPGVADRVKDRVVLCIWDYSSSGEQVPGARMLGWRVSREWLDDPAHPDAPPVGENTPFLEDLPAPVRKLLAPYRRGRMFPALFQVDIWTRLGFRVLGAGCSRTGGDAVIPGFADRYGNLRAWAKAIRRTRQIGAVATSWGRGTTFCPPLSIPDLTWPAVEEFARAMGARPKPFWPGLPAATVERLTTQLGRCTKDWRREGAIAREMETLRPRVNAHRYEWDGLILMAKVLNWHRRADFAVLEVEYFHAGQRLVEPEWERRMAEQARLLAEEPKLERMVRRHFAKRYAGDTFEEWVRDLFALRVEKLERCREACRLKLEAARQVYGR
jgi:hypothetical protein